MRGARKKKYKIYANNVYTYYGLGRIISFWHP